MNTPVEDKKWMRQALSLAEKAAVRGEVPVAALIVGPEGLIAWAINTRERQQTPIGHAEILALHKAAQRRRSWRLSDCTLYVTLEPCMMCAGAIQQSRIKRVVFGAADNKEGATNRLADTIEVTPGVLKSECSHLIKKFFKMRRRDIKATKKGKILRKRASVIVVHQNKLLGFHAVDPTTKTTYFFTPGGGLEPGETPAECAVRECLEETGYRIRIVEGSAFERKYDFRWNGTLNTCHTTFYVGELLDEWSPPQVIQDATYHQGVEWIDVKKVPELFSYSFDILWAVQKMLKFIRKKSALRLARATCTNSDT